MANEYITMGLAHIGIMTDDADKCVDFYVNKLGFRLIYSYDMNGLQLRFVDCGGCVLEFVQNGGAAGAGIVDHIAIEIQGLDALIAKLKEAGVDTFESDKVAELPGFFPNGTRNIFFKGPAGERVELYEYSRK